MDIWFVSTLGLLWIIMLWTFMYKCLHEHVFIYLLCISKSLVGCCLWGHTVGHDWSDLAAAAALLTNICCYHKGAAQSSRSCNPSSYNMPRVRGGDQGLSPKEREGQNASIACSHHLGRIMTGKEHEKIQQASWLINYHIDELNYIQIQDLKAHLTQKSVLLQIRIREWWCD